MNDDNAYHERFDPDELGRSGNEVERVQRDYHGNDDKEDPTHFDVTEWVGEDETETFYVVDEEQTWLNDF